MAKSLIKDRKRFEFTKFRGVDTSSAPTSVASNRATYMRNIIDRDGTPHNRCGWTDQETLSFPNGTIYGHYTCEFEGHKVEFVHVNNDFKIRSIVDGKMEYVSILGYKEFSFNNDGVLVFSRTYSTNKYSVPTTVSQTDSQLFFSNNKAYFVGLGCYAVFGKWSDGYYGLRKVFNNEDTYIPIIKSNINDITESATDEVIALDDYSLLTDYVGFGLVGKNSTSGSVTYDLGMNIKSTNAKVKIVENGQDVWFEGYASVDGGSSFKDGGDFSNPHRVITVYNDGSIVLEHNSTEAYNKFAPKISNTTNIYIYAQDTNYQTNDFIETANFACLFGGDGNCDRLFMTNNKYPNKVYWTDFSDNAYILESADPFTYVSDLSYISLGTGTNKINGMFNLNDSTLAIFKDHSMNENNFYVLKAETQLDEDSYTSQLKVTSSTANMPQTAVNNKCFGSLESSILFASKEGVYAVSITNANNPQRYALERSEPIRNMFKDCDMKNARAIVWDNKYFLATKYKKDTDYEEDLVFIADAKYKYTLDKNMDDTYNYEWYIFTHCPVKEWIVEDGKLGFIHHDCSKCLFNNEHRDIKLYGGANVTSITTNGITKYVMSDSVYAALNNSKKYAIKVSNSTYAATGKDFSNELVYLKNGKFVFNPDSEEEGFDLKFSVNTYFWTYEVTNVNAIWFTPVCDFGASDYVKTLFMMTIGIDSDANSDALIGYKTKYDPKVNIGKIKHNGAINFDDIGFESMTFGEAFASSYTRKVKLRNFTYIQFYFGHNNNKDFSFNNLTLLYKFNKYNKGVY